MSKRTADRAHVAFVADLGRWHIVETTTAVTALARHLLFRYDVSAADAIQLASAVWLRQNIAVAGLLAFDARLVTAAASAQFSLPVQTIARANSASTG